MSLYASWKRTAAHLTDARLKLPVSPIRGEEGGSLSHFQEYLAENELKLALDELEGETKFTTKNKS
jgi:hypothetical protein